VTVSVAIDEPEVSGMLAGLIDAVRPLGETVVPSATVPAKPQTLFTYTMSVPEELPSKARFAEPAKTPNPITITVRLTLCAKEPLVPLTSIVKNPESAELKDRAEELVPPDVKDMLDGFSEAVRPEGETTALRLTAPAKLLTLVKEMVEVPVELAWMVIVAELLNSLKSGPTTTDSTADLV
jgi:hypothetical protein